VRVSLATTSRPHTTLSVCGCAHTTLRQGRRRAKQRQGTLPLKGGLPCAPHPHILLCGATQAHTLRRFEWSALMLLVALSSSSWFREPLPHLQAPLVLRGFDPLPYRGFWLASRKQSMSTIAPAAQTTHSYTHIPARALNTNNACTHTRMTYRGSCSYNCFWSPCRGLDSHSSVQGARGLGLLSLVASLRVTYLNATTGWPASWRWPGLASFLVGKLGGRLPHLTRSPNSL